MNNFPTPINNRNVYVDQDMLKIETSQSKGIQNGHRNQRNKNLSNLMKN